MRMRQAGAWVVTAAFVVGLAAPVLAQGTQPAPTPAAPAATAPAAPVGKAPAPTDAAKPVTKTVVKKVTTKSLTGAVKSASAESLVVVAKGKDKKEHEWTFILTKGTKVTKAKKAFEAKSLAEKNAVTVKYTEEGDKKTATSVQVKVPRKS